MTDLRRIGVAVIVSLAAVGSVGVVLVATATPSAALTCSDYWQGPDSGTTAWNASVADWSENAFPGSGDVACIEEAGTYTVEITSSASVEGLQVGGAANGTQTVTVDGAGGSVDLSMSSGSTVESGGDLTVESGTDGNGQLSGAGSLTVASAGTFTTEGSSDIVYLQVPVTNQSGGTVTIGSADTLQNDDTLTTNSGSFTVASGGALAISGSTSGFTQSAGTLTLTGTLTESNGTFTQSGGALSGNPVDTTGGTLADSGGTGALESTGSTTLTGTIPADQTVTVDGAGGSVDETLPSAVTVDGDLTVESGTDGNGQLSGAGSLTVASAGTFTTEGSSDIVYLQVPVTNQSGGTVTIGSADTLQNDDTLTTNSGSFTVASGGALAISGSTSGFTQSAGTLTLTGTLTESNGTFTQSGGALSGNPVDTTGGTLADSGGTGALESTGSTTLTGTIPADQTVTVDGAGGSVDETLPSAVTVDGDLTVESGTDGNGQLSGAGSLTVASAGTFTTEGSSDIVYLQVPVTNQSGGTVTIGSADTLQNDDTLTTNSGSFTVASGGALAISGSTSGFTQSAGTLTLTGTLTESNGTFTQSGGALSGNPVDTTGGTLADSGGTGALESTGSTTLTGTIPADQTVTVDGAGGSVDETLPSAVTVDGDLTVESGTDGNGQLSGAGSLTVASAGTFTTEGSSDIVYLQVPVTNQSGGTVTIGSADTLQNDDTAHPNSGTLQVLNGGKLALSGSSSTLVNTSSGILGVTVNGTAGTGEITGSGVTVTGSTLAVTTVGSPALDSTFTPISGPVTGTFSTLSFGADAYVVTYPSNSVVLTTEAPFTAGPNSFTPYENVPTGPVQVADIGNATDGTGAYSATVNFGDGSPTVAATVDIDGSTGTVDAPSHTYTTPDEYTVTTTVSNTDGTTLTTTQGVAVIGLAVTGVSPSSGPFQGGTSVTVTGTDFVGATAVDFGSSPARFTVNSETSITAVAPPGSGTVDVTVTTPSGTSATSSSDKFTSTGGVQTNYTCNVSGFGTASFPAVAAESPAPPATIDAGGTFQTAPAAELTVPASVINHFIGVGATSLTVASQTTAIDGRSSAGGPLSGALSPNTESGSASDLPVSDPNFAADTPFPFDTAYNPVSFHTGPGTGKVDLTPGDIDAEATFVIHGTPTTESITCTPVAGVAALGSVTVDSAPTAPTFQVPPSSPPLQNKVSAGTDGGWGPIIANTSKSAVKDLSATVTVSDGHGPVTFDLAGMAASGTTCSKAGSGKLDCSIGTLAAGASDTLDILVDTSGLATGTSISGSAAVSSSNASSHATTLEAIGVVVVDSGNGTTAVATPGVSLVSTDKALKSAKATVSLTLPTAKIKQAAAATGASGGTPFVSGSAQSPPPVAVTLEVLAPSAEPALCPPTGSTKCEGDIVQAFGNFSAYTSNIDPIKAVVKFFYGTRVPAGKVYFLKPNGKTVDKLSACKKTAGAYHTPCLAAPEQIVGLAAHDNLYAQDTIYFTGNDPAMGRR